VDAAPTDTSYETTMLRVTIELLPEGYEEAARSLGELTITNDDSGTPLNGHYDTQLTTFDRDGGSFVRHGRVENFNRERSAVDLVMFALEKLNPLRRSMTMGTPAQDDEKERTA
jgi:hypothetical protein